MTRSPNAQTPSTRGIAGDTFTTSPRAAGFLFPLWCFLFPRCFLSRFGVFCSRKCFVLLPLSNFKVPGKSFLCPAVFSVPVQVFSVPAVFAAQNGCDLRGNCLLQGVGCTPRCWLGLLRLHRCAAVICVGIVFCRGSDVRAGAARCAAVICVGIVFSRGSDATNQLS